METLISNRQYFQIGEQIKQAIFDKTDLQISNLNSIFHFLDQEILTTYFAFVEKKIPDDLRKIQHPTTLAIIHAFDVLQKVQNKQIEVISELGIKFELLPAQVLMAKAELLSAIFDRKNVCQYYVKLSTFPEFLVADALREFGDLAWAAGIMENEMMMGFPIRYLERFAAMTELLHVDSVVEIGVNAIAKYENWEICVTQESARKWQILTAVMNYLMRQPVSDRSKLGYQSALEQLKIQEFELELIISEMVLKGLIKASIDTVAQVFCVTWVKPLVLDQKGRDIVVERLSEWSARIQQTKGLIERIMVEDDEAV
ncbi:PCI domain-containing protein [Spironucleus salmonicida]|uniref:PCI domain-containing protein n=1 Tax=Spironucleus salmonicida TaxID=348837 RepID=V6LHV3_9EUKA|nr:PCI domain-containing protein [Spironucleus salmonicida]|eukprot:EST43276.1 PCI domain-containing protein [Spironucleus salmonicida]